MIKNYYRLMLGKQSVHAALCFQEGFIGGDFTIARNLAADLSGGRQSFFQKIVPEFRGLHPERTKVGAGLACGSLWTIAKEIKIGDIVLCPDGGGTYRLAEVVGDYFYSSGQALPHRRAVTWLPQCIERASMSTALKNSTGSIGTICNIGGHRSEIETLISGGMAPTITTSDGTVEDPTVFALEKHLEDFLVQNWEQTELGKKYDIYEEDGQRVGQQYPSDTGPLDILAISKDKKELLVVELKRGRASDTVVGQILRYMGFVAQEIAEIGQSVTGIIIALEDDQRIRRALAVTNNITFYRYRIDFKLEQA